MTTDGPDKRVQSVRNAWINALRDETLRVCNKEQARVAHVGQMIATYADADGSNAFPGQDTIAVLVGGTDEAVARAIKVLVAVGMLSKKRRPNAPAIYQLLMPVQRPDWTKHMHLYTESRQKRAHTAKKIRDAEERTGKPKENPEPVRGRVPEPVHGGVPEPVHGGVFGTRPWTGSDDSEPVHGRPRNPSTDAFRNPSMAGGTSTPTSGRDPLPHQTVPELPHQPQVRAGARGENDQVSPAAPTQPGFAHCPVCGDPMIPRPGRATHAHCTPTNTLTPAKWPALPGKADAR